MNFCVIGAGSGGRAIAAYLASKKQNVNLYNRSYSNLRYIKKKGGIKSKNELKGFFHLNLITQDLESALSDTEIIMISIPASAHKDVAQKIAPYLSHNQIIILNPGRTFGSIEVARIIKKIRKNLRIYVAETQTLLFTSRKLKKNKVRILKIKNSINFSSHREHDNYHIYSKLKQVFPQIFPLNNYFQLTLNNIGMILHPTITLLNAGAIESQSSFKFYNEGSTERICKIIETIEFEINRIFMRLGLRRFSFCKWVEKVYGVSDNNIHDALKRIESYQDIDSPPKLNTRYFTEDIPTGLVPLASLGDYLNIETPTIDSVIYLAGLLCGINFWEVGRTVEKLKINTLLQNKLEVKASVPEASTEGEEYLFT